MWCRATSIVLVLTSVAGAQPAPPAAPALAPPEAYPPPAYVPPVPFTPRPDRFAIGLGVTAGASNKPSWLYGAWTIEAGMRIVKQPVVLRARAFANLVGGTVESDWGGDFYRAGAGAEARACNDGGGVCVFGGLDLGYQALTLYDNSDMLEKDDRGLLAGPRAGLDVGTFIRLRTAIELYRHFSSDRSFTTVGFALGLGAQL